MLFSFSGDLEIPGAVCPLLLSFLELRQPTDRWGRPAGRVQSARAVLLVEEAYGHLFEEATGAEREWERVVLHYRSAVGATLKRWELLEVRCPHVYGDFSAQRQNGLPAFYYVVELVARYWDSGAGRLDTWTGRLVEEVALPPLGRSLAAPAPTPGLRSTPLRVPPAEAWLADLETVLGPEAGVRALVRLWVAGGLSEQKLKSAIRGAVDKRLVFERLRNVKKGIYEQRVVIDDYTNIPGVNNKPYVPNGLPDVAIPASIFGVNDSAFDLPKANAPTFTGSATLVEIKPGEKLYRVTSDPSNDKYARTGGYWTRTPPTNLAEVIGGTAVMPEWNNFQRVYEFTAPPYADPDNEEPKFYAWEGPTAAQAVSGRYEDKIDNGYSLAGGEQQVFIPNKLSRDPNFGNHIQDITSLHKSW